MRTTLPVGAAETPQAITVPIPVQEAFDLARDMVGGSEVPREVSAAVKVHHVMRHIGRKVMVVEKRRDGSGVVEKSRDLRAAHSHRRGWSGDSGELWSRVGVDVESMSPKAQAVTGVVTGGAILLAAALFILFTDLWWLILIFCWMVFPALGTFARGVAGLMEPRQEEQLPQNSKERELLEALRDRGELTPAQAAVETSLTVKEADGMLSGLAEAGHLEIRVHGGGLSYSLWNHEKDEDRGIGRFGERGEN